MSPKLAKKGVVGNCPAPVLPAKLVAQPQSVASNCPAAGRTGSGMGAGAGFLVGRSAARAGKAANAPTATNIAFAPPDVGRPSTRAAALGSGRNAES